EGADGRRLIGAVDAVNRLAEIERARTERIAIAAGHEARQIGLALDHFFRRMPIGPFRHSGHLFRAGPGEALAADADAVTQRLAVAEHEIEIGVRRIDDDRAGRLLGIVVDERALELRRQLLARTGLGSILRRQRRITRIALDGSGGAGNLPRPDRQRWPGRFLLARWCSRGRAVVGASAGSGRLITLRHLSLRGLALRGLRRHVAIIALLRITLLRVALLRVTLLGCFAVRGRWRKVGTTTTGRRRRGVGLIALLRTALVGRRAVRGRRPPVRSAARGGGGGGGSWAPRRGGAAGLGAACEP